MGSRQIGVTGKLGNGEAEILCGYSLAVVAMGMKIPKCGERILKSL
jgi:hypothetical protein